MHSVQPVIPASQTLRWSALHQSNPSSSCSLATFPSSSCSLCAKFTLKWVSHAKTGNFGLSYPYSFLTPSPPPPPKKKKRNLLFINCILRKLKHTTKNGTYIRAGSMKTQLQRSIGLGPSSHLQLQIKLVLAVNLHLGGVPVLLSTGQTFLPLQLAQRPQSWYMCKKSSFTSQGSGDFSLALEQVLQEQQPQAHLSLASAWHTSVSALGRLGNDLFCPF